MAHVDQLFAAARSASGQPQPQGNKDARHGAHAGATTPPEAASDAAASPKTETHESDAQETKPTDASAPKPEADAKEAGAAGVPEFKADPAAAPTPAPSPAPTMPPPPPRPVRREDALPPPPPTKVACAGPPARSYVMHATRRRSGSAWRSACSVALPTRSKCEL